MSLPCRMMLVSACFASSTALAEAKDPTFQLNQALIVVKSTAATNEANGGAKTESKTSATEFAPNGLEFVINAKGFHLHFFPTSSDSPLQLGYDVISGLEVGLTLNVESVTVDKPKDESRRSTYGLYATYALQIGKPTIEFALAFDSLADSSKVTDATSGVTTETDSSGTAFGLGFNYIHPIIGELSYLFQLAYSSESLEDDKSKTKSTSTTTGVMPIGVRLDF